MFDLINVPVFIISFAIGIFFVYVIDVEKRTIVIYPTPENVERMQYKDEASNCFNYSMKKTKCPSEKFISKIPMQK